MPIFFQLDYCLAASASLSVVELLFQICDLDFEVTNVNFCLM